MRLRFQVFAAPAAFLLAVLAILTAAPAPARAAEFQLDLDAGYRRDRLEWSIAGFIDEETFVDVLSELTWEDLESYQIRGAGRFAAGRTEAPVAFWLRGSAAYAEIVAGENRDSDYAGSGRTLEFSRSENGADDGDLLDLSVGAGPRFRLGSGSVIIAPLAGLSYHEQNLTISDGRQTLSREDLAPPDFIPPPVGSLENLASTYETQWAGPWLGVDVEVRPVERLLLTAGLEYHWANFEAVADWNLRSDFEHPRSFEQEADGTGVVLALAGRYALSERLGLRLGFDYRDWETGSGTDRVFLADGAVAASRLNEVTWRSWAATMGVSWRFF